MQATGTLLLNVGFDTKFDSAIQLEEYGCDSHKILQKAWVILKESTLMHSLSFSKRPQDSAGQLVLCRPWPAMATTL